MAEAPQERIPVDEVQRLAAAGRNEREIITTLRSQGYSNEQISKALNRVLKFTVGGDITPSGPAPMAAPARALPQPPRQPAYPQGPPGPPQAPRPPQSMFGSAPEQQQFTVQSPMEQYAPREMEQLPSGGNVIDMTAQEEVALEELVEEIINEKWKDVEAHLAELDRLYGAVMERLDVLEQKFNDVMEKHNDEKTELKDMLTETTDHLQGLEGRIGSVERAFKDFLPALTDNVRALSKIVEQVKQSDVAKKREK